jgi:AraC-like DNA-binding protein
MSSHRFTLLQRENALIGGPQSISRPLDPSTDATQLCLDHFSVVEPQISADGVHSWPFDSYCPIDVAFLAANARQRVRMNRHRYFEVIYMFSGSANYHIQDRLLPLHQGDLAIVGSNLYHRLEWSSPSVMIALFFEPDLIRCDGADSAEYLRPFLLQDSQFPHVVSGDTGVPREVLDLMLKIRAALPLASPRARLTLKTYLKMILVHLVDQYESYAATLDAFQRHQRDIDRLRPLFDYLGQNYGNPPYVREAARVCGMSQTYFMSFFKQVTGQSFTRYLNQFRIERAQSLLAGTDESMAGISQQVGFSDQSHFGMVFRKVTGMTPASYRRRFQKTN